MKILVDLNSFEKNDKRKAEVICYAQIVWICRFKNETTINSIRLTKNQSDNHKLIFFWRQIMWLLALLNIIRVVHKCKINDSKNNNKKSKAENGILRFLFFFYSNTSPFYILGVYEKVTKHFKRSEIIINLRIFVRFKELSIKPSF